MFIKLTMRNAERENFPLWVNINQIREIYEEPYEDEFGLKTALVYSTGSVTTVVETPEEIMAMIKAKELMRD